jgi:hypothetical protein
MQAANSAIREFVPRLRERIAKVAGTVSFHVTPAVET